MGYYNHRPEPTEYRGVRFRSRLESEWARFFDALGLTWEYEPESFTIDAGAGDTARYTPDFRVVTPRGTAWIEVKPNQRFPSVKFSLFACHIRDAGREEGERCLRLDGAPTGRAAAYFLREAT